MKKQKKSKKGGKEGRFSYAIFKTRFGWCGVLKSESGLRRVFLPEKGKDSLKKKLLKEFPGAKEEKTSLKGLIPALKGYFEGKNFQWSGPLDLPTVPPIHNMVYGMVKKIPYGEVRTYSWVGKRLGNPFLARAVGGALRRNPLPIVVPCHRIVRKNGHLGGFSGPGGLKLKAKLLQLEGVAEQKGFVDRREPL